MSTENKLHIAHLNVRSLFPKLGHIREILNEHKYDVLAVTETWLNSNIHDDLLFVEDYNLLRNDRSTRGGGVCFYIRNGVIYKKENEYKTLPDLFEQLWISINSNGIKFGIGVVYRPPNSGVTSFIDSFENMISTASLHFDQLVCLGDMNLNVLNENDTSVKQFLALLDTIGLKQLVTEPTRISLTSVTLIDLIIANEGLSVTNKDVLEVDFSDHHLIECIIDLKKEKFEPVTHTYRDYSKLNTDKLNHDLSTCNWSRLYSSENVDEKIDILNEFLLYAFDINAPLKTTTFHKSFSPWITPNIKFMQKLQQKALQKYKKTRQKQHWDYYKSLRN